jgi:hypothetical protein
MGGCSCRPYGLLIVACLSLCLVGVLAGCEAVPLGQASGGSTTIPPAQCSPSAQDRYVYHPARLKVLQTCIHVTGVVSAIRIENDGDRHLQVMLDPQYQDLLRSANRFEANRLVVEPVCVSLPLQPDALATCVADADPLQTLPSVGQHVWMEGRYALDLEHGSWAELHPLYRWGLLTTRTVDHAGMERQP